MRPALLSLHLPAQNEENPLTYANHVINNKKTVHGIKNHHGSIKGMVTGIYIRGDIIYYQIRLINKSTIDYDVDLLRFYTRDRKKGKRTAIQENELTPVCIAGDVSRVKASGKNVIVAAMEKFTLPRNKFFGIQVIEKNGGRQLLLKVRDKKITKAVPLADECGRQDLMKV